MEAAQAVMAQGMMEGQAAPQEARAGRGSIAAGRRRRGEGAHLLECGAARERHGEHEGTAGDLHAPCLTRSRTTMVVPCLFSDRASMVPSCIWMIRYTMESPMPLPSGLVVK